MSIVSLSASTIESSIRACRQSVDARKRDRIATAWCIVWTKIQELAVDPTHRSWSQGSQPVAGHLDLKIVSPTHFPAHQSRHLPRSQLTVRVHARTTNVYACHLTDQRSLVHGLVGHLSRQHWRRAPQTLDRPGEPQRSGATRAGSAAGGGRQSV